MSTEFSVLQGHLEQTQNLHLIRDGDSFDETPLPIGTMYCNGRVAPVLSRYVDQLKEVETELFAEKYQISGTREKLRRYLDHIDLACTNPESDMDLPIKFFAEGLPPSTPMEDLDFPAEKSMAQTIGELVDMVRGLLSILKDGCEYFSGGNNGLPLIGFPHTNRLSVIPPSQSSLEVALCNPRAIDIEEELRMVHAAFRAWGEILRPNIAIQHLSSYRILTWRDLWIAVLGENAYISLNPLGEGTFEVKIPLTDI